MLQNSTERSVRSPQPRPFLKWAGGKRWLVDSHSDIFPEFSGRYVEPFLGGASVFFHLLPERAILSDSNPGLIECYREVRSNTDAVITLLKYHHRVHSKEHYYKVRSQRFKHGAQRAAQFLYLNRTCFNGLYRVNRLGEFNVPIGSKSKVFDPDEPFGQIAAALENADIESCDFELTINKACTGDFLFVDPPYTVKHDSNGFLKYNEKIFSWADQVRLRNSIVRAAERGARVVLTNAAHDSVQELYNGIGTTHFVNRSSVLAGKSSARGSVKELIVTIE